MSEESGFERTEPASARRREQSREEGQVARSRELSTLALLLTVGGGLWFMGSWLALKFWDLMRGSMQMDRALAFDTNLLLLRLKDFSLYTMLALAPLLALVVIAGIASALALNGWLFSLKPLVPDWSRMDPLKGLARMVSWHGAIEMFKAIAKAGLVGGVACWVLWDNAGAVFSLAGESLTAGVVHMVHLAGTSFLIMSGSMAIVVAIDVPFQIWDHERKLRMTREEVRRENKETEGDPHVKAHVRAQQREMARRRMMAEIPKADVVVTNPTHYAVALRYQDDRMRAPRVVAKGANLVAAHIRALAEEHRVPILEAPPLARALYRHTDLGAEIPAALYTAVAEVLAYVYQLRRYRDGSGPRPQAPERLQVPPDLDPGAHAA